MTNLTYVSPFFIVTSLKTSVSFYVDKLGFEVRYIGPDDDPFFAIVGRNVVKAVGSYIANNELYKWVRETNTNALQLNTHVMYIHTKFLLKDPLSNDPIVVTGSANFSQASTNENDENMLIIRGNTRVADIYFTEFNRLFNHYYFRAVMEQTQDKGRDDPEANLFLTEDDKWLKKYARGKLRAKRVELYQKMEGTKG